MNVKTKLLQQMQAQNKPINDICNIKLGKKYLFKTVQSPSTQSEHINCYSFGFGGFGLGLLRTENKTRHWLLISFHCNNHQVFPLVLLHLIIKQGFRTS